MRLRLIRHATVLLSTGGKTILVDPMLDPAGARPPVENTPNQRDNPLVELPEPAEVVVHGLDAIVVTHLHQDHFDATAAALLPKDVPLFCAPDDSETLRGHGFDDVRPVDDRVDWEGIGDHADRGSARAARPVARVRRSARSTSPGTRSGATRCAPRSTSTGPRSWS